jgi:RNA polymerase sigma-70 factor (ECF subfamily)
MDLEDLAGHAEGLRALARKLVGDAAAADDVVQEACLAALRRRPTGGVPWRPWLVAVVRNLSLKRRRDEARRVQRERRAARPERVASADEAVERAELQRALLDELLALEEPYRAAMILRHVEGLPLGEIARRLGVPPGTVAARLHRGLETLRGRLDRRFGGRVAWCVLFVPFVRRPRVAAWGALAMSTKKTASLALILLALGALVGTLLWKRSGGAPGARSERAAATPAAGSEPQARAAPPGPADLDAIDRDLDLFGVVVDASGTPVSDARVEAFWYPWQRGGIGTGDLLREEAKGPATTTPKDGRFALRLRRCQQVNLRTQAQGFATSELSCFQAGERVRIVLGAGVRVVFECVDEEGRGVAGARLSLSRGEGESPGRNFVERRGEAGADGRCVIDGLPAGEWGYLNVLHGRHAGVWRRVTFPGSGETSLRIVLSEGRVLRGIVRDDETGAPVPGARVGVSWVMLRHVLTDALGRYELPGWGFDQGTVNVGVSAEGYARKSRLVGPDDVLDFTLQRGSDLTGRVVGADARPVAGALLCVRGRDDASDFSTYVQGASAPDGTFLLRGIGRGITNTLTVAAPGHGRYLLDFNAPGSAAPIDLGDVAPPEPRAIEGRVLFADGATAPGILVQLEGGNTDRGRLLDGGEPGFRTGADREERRADDLGRFRFCDLAPGRYTLTCIAAGYRAVPLEVSVPQSGDATGIDLSLSAGHDLVARLVRTDGEPVWGMFVKAQLADGGWLQVMSDARGLARFRADAAFESLELRDHERGRYRIPPPRRLPSGTTEVTIELEPAAVAEGIVLDLEGRPLPQAALRVVARGESVDQGAGDAFSGLDGRFRVVVPASGTADICLSGIVNRMEGIHKGDLPPFGGRVEGVVPGAKGLVLRARPLTFDRALTVKVLGPDGLPLKDAQVYARDARGTLVPGANVLSDGSGVASLTGLPDGDVSVWAKARREGGEDWIEPFAYPLLPDGQTFTLRFREGVRVRGRVGAGDAPAAGASVYAYRKTELVRTVLSDADGRFSLLVPVDTEMPLKLVAMRWEGRTLLDASVDRWAPGDGEAVLQLAPRGK